MHNCPLKAAVLGAWGSAPTAVAPPQPPQPAPQPAPAPAPVTPQTEAGFDMRPHRLFDNPMPQISLEKTMPPASSNGEADDDRDAQFHVEKQEDPNVGKVIGERYRVTSVVGRGGMGMVYKADHITIDRPVAIKMLYPNTVADAEAVKRFKQEAQAVSKVEHQHVVRIYDFGMSDLGQPYIVMDFLDGRSLCDEIAVDLLNITRADDIFSQVVAGLACAHKAGVTHRDLKPANIMLTSKGGKADWVTVVDFGISSFTGEEQGSPMREVRGSPPYMSPEQCSKSATIDHRSDVYSLAVVLYEALTGRLPYNARNTSQWIEQHISGKPIPLQQAHAAMGACEALSTLIAKAMEKNPDKRFQTIEEFGAELKEAVRRDQIHQGYLRNRVEALGGSSSRLPALSPAELYGEPASFDTSLVAVRAIRDSDLEKSGPQTDKFVFVKCPHCGESVEPEVAFCLGCGRTLATSQDFAKVRAAQGVFTLPKGETLSATIPAFSQKTKQKGGFAALVHGFNRLLLLLSLVLVVCIFWYMGGVEWIAKTVLNKQPAVSQSQHE